EVALGEAFDGRADQYALAATVYEALSGRVPFNGTSLHAIIMQQTAGQIPPLAELAPGLPAALIQAVERGLHQHPEKRFPDCASFAKAVLAAAKGVSNAAVKAGAAPVTAKPASFKMSCPSCKASFTLASNFEGKFVTCPKCGAKYAVAK